MSSLRKFVFSITIINTIICLPVCKKSNNRPAEYENVESKTINPTFSDKVYNTINVGNKIFLTENTRETPGYGTSGSYRDSEFCPEDFKIPLQSDYQELIDSLGTRAYSVFTDTNGLNFEKGKYYLTNTKGKETYNKMLLYIDNDSLKFVEESRGAIRCILKIPSVNVVGPFSSRDIELNEEITINVDDNRYLNSYLWKIDGDIFKTETVSYRFAKSGHHKLEFWAKYINETEIYSCHLIYVNKKPVSSSQTFSNSKIKTFNTNYKMLYIHRLHFEHSNFPIAPRDNGGYYIAFTDTNKFLHVLSYNKEDVLILIQQKLPILMI